jgi:hypothetical protein
VLRVKRYMSEELLPAHVQGTLAVLPELTWAYNEPALTLCCRSQMVASILRTRCCALHACLAHLPIAAFPNAWLASSAGRSSDVGQGNHIATGAAVAGVSVCMDLTPISGNPIAVFVPEDMQSSITRSETAGLAYVYIDTS